MTVAIPHPNGMTARVIVPPHTASMPSLTSDEELLIAQHAEIERLRAAMRAALPFCMVPAYEALTAGLEGPNVRVQPAPTARGNL